VNGVYITGCPKSGTTGVARVFQEHGLEFGELGPNMENETISSLCEMTLNISGGIWFLPPAALFRPVELNYDMDEVLAQDLGSDGSLKAIKDPRLCLTYGVLREHLPEWPFIVVLRHPLAMAKSLENLNKQPITTGLGAWHRFYSDFLLWEEIYGLDTRWVEYPSMQGMEAALGLLGVEYQGPIGLEQSMIHDRQGDAIPGHFEDIYQSLKRRTLL